MSEPGNFGLPAEVKQPFRLQLRGYWGREGANGERPGH